MIDCWEREEHDGFIQFSSQCYPLIKLNCSTKSNYKMQSGPVRINFIEDVLQHEEAESNRFNEVEILALLLLAAPCFGRPTTKAMSEVRSGSSRAFQQPMKLLDHRVQLELAET